MASSFTSAPLPLLGKRKYAESNCDLGELNTTTWRSGQPPLVTPPPSLLPARLTAQNLRLHTQLENSEESSSMTGRSTTATTAADHDDEVSLAKHRIKIHSHAPLPLELRRFLRDVVEVKRVPESPSAKHLHDAQPFAQSLPESKSIELIGTYLRFPDKLNPGDVRAEANIYLAHETRFERLYVKHADGTRLTQPRPDRVNAYMPSSIAKGYIPVPFTPAQELILSEGNINPAMFAPWLTAQFKSALIGLLAAALQGARDGYAVQRYLLSLFQRAGITPTVIDTLHWSLTCNTQMAQLFCHWYDHVDNRYHMYELCSAGLRAPFHNLDRNPDMVQMRMCLRNILDWSQHERLDRIREVVNAIEEKRQAEDIELAEAEARLQAKTRADAEYTASKRGKKGPSRKKTTTGSHTVGFQIPCSSSAREQYGGNRQHEASPQNTTGRASSGASSKRFRTERFQGEDSEDELAA